MPRFFVLLAALIGACGAAFGQPLDVSTLSGRYHFVELLVQVDAGGFSVGAEDAAGSITFDGVGGFLIAARRGIDGGAAQDFATTGAYEVAPSGFVRLDNPLAPDLTINARLGQGGEVLLGGSTEALDGSRDFFVAVRAPAAGASAATLQGDYAGASLWLPGGFDDGVRTALVDFAADGQGGLTRFDLEGHAADAGEEPLFEPRTGSYTVAADGAGGYTLSAGSALAPADRRLFVSADGNYIVGFSEAAGDRDLFIAISKTMQSTTSADFTGTFWMLDLFVNPGSFYESGVGGLRSGGDGTVSIAQRLSLGLDKTDFSGVNFYSLNSDGTGFLRGFTEPGVTNFAIGGGPAGSGTGGQATPPQAFVGAEVNQVRPFYLVHGLSFGVRVPDFAPADGPFLQPLGALNAASFAPATNPVSGGTLLSLFGSNLATGTFEAGTTPLPTELGGVSVTVGGIAAPLFFVSPTQINLQTPFDIEGLEVEIRATRNGQPSNVITAPAAATSPGVFSLLQTGVGPGAILHADFTLVSEQDPAAPGETVIIFLTGLGALDPPFADGAPGPVDPLSEVVDSGLQVEFGVDAGTVSFAGAAPGFVGLYQVNVEVPASVPSNSALPLRIVTSNAVSDYVDIAIQ